MQVRNKRPAVSTSDDRFTIYTYSIPGVDWWLEHAEDVPEIPERLTLPCFESAVDPEARALLGWEAPWFQWQIVDQPGPAWFMRKRGEGRHGGKSWMYRELYKGRKA